MSNNNSKKKKVVVKQPSHYQNNHQYQANKNIEQQKPSVEEVNIQEEVIIEDQVPETEVMEELVEEDIQEEIIEEENFQKPEPTKEVFEHMYRVRLDWDRPDTQIFASPILQDAIEYASSHEGYKVYIDDDGELECDPWIKQEKEEVNNPGYREIIHPIPGHIISLDKTPVYRTAFDKYPFNSFTGDYYFYDRTITNKRAKITTCSNVTKPDPSLIFGYIIIE